MKKENVALGLVVGAWLLWLAYRGRLVEFIGLAKQGTSSTSLTSRVKESNKGRSFTDSALQGGRDIFNYFWEKITDLDRRKSQ